MQGEDDLILDYDADSDEREEGELRDNEGTVIQMTTEKKDRTRLTGNERSFGVFQKS